MASAFNLTAELNLRGPANIRNVVADIRRQLGTINTNVNVRLDPGQSRGIATINRALTRLNTTLATTTQNANAAAVAMQNFTSSIGNINGGVNQLNRAMNNTATAVQNNTRQMTTVARQTRNTTTAMEEFGRQSALAVRRFASFSIATGLILGLARASKSALTDFISFEKQLVKLSQITGESLSGLSSLSGTITSLSTGLGVSSKSLIDIASTLAQAGLTARDTEKALKALALTELAPSFDNLNRTVEGSIALMRQFDISAQDLEKALGSINSVAAKFAVESGDIIAAIQRTGGVFASASKGVSEGTQALNEFIAVFTSVRATTRESAETIATGLRTIFTRIQRGDTIDALKAYGVNLTDVEGKFVGAYKAVELLSRGLSTLDPRDLRFSQIVEELGGFRQIGKVIPLIQQFATASEALKVAQAGQGSLAADAAKAQLSLAIQATKVKEEFLALFREIGGSDTFQNLARGALQLASALISVADSVKGILPVLTVFLAFRGARAATQYGSGFLRNIIPGRGAANGGPITRFKDGGLASVALMPGEAVVFPEQVSKIGLSTLKKMNYADKRQKKARGGSVGVVPGTGNSDSFYTKLPVGSFVIRKRATEALGVDNIQDIASGRKKYAIGGSVTGKIASMPSSIVRSSVRESEYSFQKPSGKEFLLYGKQPNKFNPEDKYKISIDRRPVSVDLSDTDIAKSKLSRYSKALSRSQDQSLSPSKRNRAARSRGYAFEEILASKYGVKLEKGNKFSRLDGVLGNDVVEARSRAERTSDAVIANKMVSGALSGSSQSEKILKNRLTQKRLRNAPDVVDLGSVILFEDVTSNVLKNTNMSTANRKPTRQKLMAGQLVKEQYISPQNIILGLKDKKFGDPAFLQKSIMDIFGSSDIIDPNGMKVRLDDALSPRYRGSAKSQKLLGPEFIAKLSKLDKVIRDRFAALRANQTELTRDRTPAETAFAKGQGLLFGAAGMFGRRFGPRPMTITQANGLKKDTPVTVFGSVLDRNNIEKRARIEQLKKSKGVTEQDLTEVAASPTASRLSKSFQKETSNIIGKQNKDYAKSYISAIAKTISPSGGGTSMFLDFDRTLAFGADKIGGKISKKNPDYSAFNDTKKVAEGLQKASLTGLGQSIKRIINNLRQKDPALAKKFIERMFVVSARPARTMPLIARWLRNQGIRISPKNVRGVGGPGVATSAIGIKKAELISQLGKGGSSSVFIDDDSGNIARMQQDNPNIKSIQYGYSPNLKDKKVRQQLATEEGYQFEKYVNERLPPNLKTAIFQREGEGIDFPFGLDPATAKYWFNDLRLVGVPVDTKRKISGPSTIKDNIISYLKMKGFSGGGSVQKLAGGGLTTNEVPIIAEKGEFVVNKKSAQSIGYNNLHQINRYHTGGVVQKLARGTSVRPLYDDQTIRSGQLYELRSGDGDALNRREQIIRARAAARQDTRRQNIRNSPQAKILREGINEDTNRLIANINKKYGTELVLMDRINQIKQKALAKYGIRLSDDQAIDQSMKMQKKANREIAAAKQTAAQRYRQGLKNMVTDTTGGVSSPYNPKEPMGGSKKGQEYYDQAARQERIRAARQERIQAARQQRSGGIRGRMRSLGLIGRDFVSNTVPQGLRSVGLMPRTQQQITADAQRTASNAIAPIAMARRSSNTLRTVIPRDSDGALQSVGYRGPDPRVTSDERIAALKARKQALIDAGYGKGGAGTQAILAGRASQGLAGRNTSGGGGGTGGGIVGGLNRMMGGNAAMTASFMLPMIMDMFNGGTPTTESGAKSQAMTQGIATTAGTSLMMGSMVSQMTEGMGGLARFAGPAALAVTAVVGFTKAMIDAENAARQFAIESAGKKLEISLERVSKSMDIYNKDVKNAVAAQNVVSDLGRSTRNATSLGEAQSRTQRGWMNLFDTGMNSDIRSEILMRRGTGAYLQASGSDEALSREYATLIPEKAAELAKNFAGVAQQASAFLESRFKQGASTEDLQKDPQYQSFIKSLALADTAVQESILSIKNLAGVSEQEKRRRISEVIAIESTEKARQIESDAIKAMKIEELNRSTNQFQNSLERMFQNMEQAINRSSFALDNLSQKAELSASALSGSAKTGKTNLQSINVLENQRAYGIGSRMSAINNVSSTFGDSDSTIRGLLLAAGTLEDTILSTINRTIIEDPGTSDTKIGIKIEENIDKALQGLALPSDITSKLGKEVRGALGKLRTRGDEKIDFADLVEKIPQLSKVMESAKRAQEVAIKVLKHWENALNSYGESMNQIVDIQIQANERLRKADDISVRGRINLAKALGKEVSLRDEVNASLSPIRAQTGGITDPQAIKRNILSLETTRAIQQQDVADSGQQVGNAAGVIAMQKNLNLTNIALRENYAALKSLADSSEGASLAMSKINEIQQKRTATENLIEKAISSSPEELTNFNRALARLQNNMLGRVNVGSTAKERQESLSVMKDILPLLGTGEKQNELRANVLESMLQESGVGISPIFAQALQSLRNPEGDSEMQKAIEEYKKSNELQEKANNALAELDQKIIANTEASSATALVAAMQGVTFNFNNSKLSDIKADIKAVRNILDARLAAQPAQNRAAGGMIYAAAGQFVNFQPKGTDTVPAMLTPGEFVVNRQATKQNLPLLNKINSGSYSSGGPVRYYNKGGFVAPNFLKENVDYLPAAEPVTRNKYPLPFDEKSKVSYDGTSNMVDLYAAPGHFYASIVGSEDGIFPSVSYTDIQGQKVKQSVNWNGLIAETNLGRAPTSISKATRSYQDEGGSGYEESYFADKTNYKKNGQQLLGKFFADTISTKIPYDKLVQVQRLDQQDFIRGYKAVLGSISRLGEIDFDQNKQEITLGSQKIYGKPPESIINPTVNTQLKPQGFITTLSNLTAEDDNLYYPSPVKDLNSGNSSTYTNAFPMIYSSYDDNRLRDGGAYANYHARIDSIKSGFEGTDLYGNKVSNRIREVVDNSYSYGELGRYMNRSMAYISTTAQIKNTFENALKNLEKEKFTSELESDVQKQNTYAALENLWYDRLPYLLFQASDPRLNTADSDRLLLSQTQSTVTPGDAIINLIRDRVLQNQQDKLDLFNSIASSQKSDFEYNGTTKGLEYVRLPPGLLSDKDVNDILRGGGLTSEVDSKALKNTISSTPSKYAAIDLSGPKPELKTGLTSVNDKQIPYSAGYSIEEDSPFFYNSEDKRIVKPNEIKGLGGGWVGGGFTLWRPMSGLKSALDVVNGDSPGNADDVNKYIKEFLDGSRKDLLFTSSRYRFGIQQPGNIFTLENANNQYDFGEFWKNLETKKQQIDKMKTEEAIAGAFTPDVVEKKDISNFVGKKVTLARQLANYFNNKAKGLNARTIKLPEKLEDIPRVADAIAMQIPKSLPTDDIQRNRLDAYRAFFYSIYDEKKGPSEILQKLGVGFNDDLFQGEAPKVKTNLGTEYVPYYNNGPLTNDLIAQIIARQIAMKTSATTITQLEDADAEALKIVGDAELYDRDKPLTDEEKKNYVPSNWNDIKNIGLNPRNIFPDMWHRGRYLLTYTDFIKVAKNKSGRPLFPQEIKEKKLDNLQSIKEFFRYPYDYYRNKEALDTAEKQLKESISTKSADSFDNTTFGIAKILLDRENMRDLYSKVYDAANIPFKIESDGMKLPNFSEYQQLIKFELDKMNLEIIEDKRGFKYGNKDLDYTVRQKQQTEEQAQTPVARANGGLIYASNGTLVNFKPIGTDTVPAMLTPGEFVINRRATQKHLPVLQAINSGTYSRGGLAQNFQLGGIVSPKYYADAGRVSGNNNVFDFTKFLNGMVGQISSAVSSAIKESLPRQSASPNGVSSIDNGSLEKINEFTNRLKSVADALAGLSAIPSQITLTHTHNIIINGDSALNSLTPDLLEIAMQSIQGAFDQFVNENQEPGAPLRRINVREQE